MREARELATDDNFDEERYLLANPDIANHVRKGGNAWNHFQRHGRAEGRMQIAPTGPARSRRRERYDRLSHVLDAGAGAGGEFTFLDRDGTFPILYGSVPYTIDDYDSESANAGLGWFADEVAANPDKTYLDVGCGLRSVIYDNCLYLEVYPSPSADIVMEPACRYPIASASLDGIGCFAVLEHVKEPWVAAKEFLRMLKPGGKLFIDWPFLQPVHGYPSHFYNATREGLRQLFAEGFDLLDIATLSNQTPDHTISWILRSLMSGINDPATKEMFLNTSVGDLVQKSPGDPWWKSVVDSLSADVIEELACGNCLIARKI